MISTFAHLNKIKRMTNSNMAIHLLKVKIGSVDQIKILKLNMYQAIKDILNRLQVRTCLVRVLPKLLEKLSMVNTNKVSHIQLRKLLQLKMQLNSIKIILDY